MQLYTAQHLITLLGQRNLSHLFLFLAISQINKPDRKHGVSQKKKKLRRYFRVIPTDKKLENKKKNKIANIFSLYVEN